MRYTLTIDLDNAAFEDPAELSRILRMEAARFVMSADAYPHVKTVQDVNGNTVGQAEITSDGDDDS